MFITTHFVQNCFYRGIKKKWDFMLLNIAVYWRLYGFYKVK